MMTVLASVMRSSARVLPWAPIRLGGGGGGGGGALASSRSSRRSLILRDDRLPRITTTANDAFLGLVATFRTTTRQDGRAAYADIDDDDDGYLPFATLHELVRNATSAYGTNPLFGTYVDVVDDDDATITKTTNKTTGGRFEWTTYGEFGKDVMLARSVLRDQLGVVPYSRIGIISNNRREWAIIASAAYSLSAVLVPMYESQLPNDWGHILVDSGCEVLFCSTENVYLRAKKYALLPYAPDVRVTMCLDAHADEPHSFRGAMARAERMTMFGSADERRRKEEEEDDDDGIITIAGGPSPDDLANLIYTSGTTGKPKGVELIHSNQVSNIKGCRDMGISPFDFPMSSDRSLAFLPWAHSYGQTCELWCLMSQGASMGICRGVPHILEDLRIVEPTLLYAVPALYKKVHDGVINGMNDARPVKRALVRSALRLGRADAACRNGLVRDDGTPFPRLGLVERFAHAALDSIVLSKIRALFGGRLRAGFVAGAACPGEIINFMDAVGIPVCEGYGLTETSPVIAFNNLSRRRAGSVGQVVSGVTVWIVDSEGNPLGHGEEGEICCSGPNVMKGYHNNPEATDEVITLAPDGKSRLFHTGDLGKLDSDGFISVTGRIKEQYKLENGKYVCPTPIEEALGMSRFISQVVVCGANRPHNVALVVPDWVAIRSELGMPANTPEEELVNSDRVKGLIGAEIKLNCYGIKKFEVPAAFAFVAPFTASNNMVTPKMSIRRHVVIKSYEDVISDLYERRINNIGYLPSEEKLKVA